MSEQRYAILIASSLYPLEPKLEPLRCPENDVDALNEILTSKDYGAFSESTVLKNQPHYEIQRKIHQVLKRAGREDLVLLYYSGHGKLDPAGGLHLATADTEVDSLEATSISVDTIRNYINISSCCKIVLILDCCYGGAVGQAFLRGGSVDDQLQLISRGRGTYILTASTEIQVAQEKEGDQYGLLTKHIIGGIKDGGADSNDNGLITMDNLYNYVFDQVRQESFQEPMKWDLNVRGDQLIIARTGKPRGESRRRRIRAQLFEIADNLPDAILLRALEVITLEPDSVAEEYRSYNELLDQLFQKHLAIGRFIEKWYEVKPDSSSSVAKQESVPVLTLNPPQILKENEEGSTESQGDSSAPPHVAESEIMEFSSENGCSKESFPSAAAAGAIPHGGEKNVLSTIDTPSPTLEQTFVQDLETEPASIRPVTSEQKSSDETSGLSAIDPDVEKAEYSDSDAEPYVEALKTDTLSSGTIRLLRSKALWGLILLALSVGAIVIILYSTRSLHSLPLSIDGLNVSDLTANEATVVWNTNEPTDAQVHYGITTNYEDSTNINPNTESAHKAVITGLTPDTAYHYRVKSRAADGKEIISEDLTFTTPKALDASSTASASRKTPPVISGVAISDVAIGEVKVIWSTDQPSTSRVEYREVLDYDSGYGPTRSTPLDSQNQHEHTVIVRGKFPESAYQFRVKSQNADGSSAKSAWTRFFPTPTPNATNEEIVRIQRSKPSIPPENGIFYPRNSARICCATAATLDEIALRLQQNPKASLIIGGFRDASEVNHISITRANNARDYLVGRGIDSTRIRTRNFSATSPHESGDANLNRRAEFWIIPGS